MYQVFTGYIPLKAYTRYMLGIYIFKMSYTWYIPGIYLKCSRDMTIWFVYLVSTMFTINGFVPYRSRYWIDMSYDRYFI